MEPNKEYYAPMHTAEHILNATMVKMFNCERSFSNHIERKKSKCDYHFHKELSQDEITKIEYEVNKVINQNLDVLDEEVNFDEAFNRYNLKRISREATPTICIVKIGEYDACPCIGAHVQNTSEIGTFKITTTSFDNEVLRIRYKLLKNKPVE